MKVIPLSAGFLLVFAACVSVGKTVMMPGLAPVPETSVQVFLPGDSVPPHDRVAILEGKFNDAQSSNSKVLNKVRKEAAKLGANGLVIVGTEREGMASRVLNTVVTGTYTGGRAATQAIAIRLK